MVFKAGVLFLQRVKFPGDVPDLEGFRKAEIQVSACKIIQRQELFLNLVCHRDKILRTVPKESAFFRKGNAEAVTGKQFFAQLILQRLQRLGKRRLCNMKHFGGPGHVFFPCHCQEIA